MAFEQTVKNLDNCLRTDKGCTSELDYVEQTSWILFLKYLDDLEKSRKLASELQDIPYTPIIAEGYRWNDWAMPRTASGEYDTANALVGDDLIEFVNGKLFPYLRKFRDTGRPKSIEVKIGVIFSEIRNRIQSGYNLRDILEQVDTLRFQTQEERHEMTYWYESRLNRMGNAGRNGGEYYTPRPLIRAIVKIVDPQIGKTVYDGACGSAGFLCEAYNYMHERVKRTEDEKILQEETFTGKDDKALPYIIATMNMILHGVESPNIINTNTLTENLAEVQERDRFDYILANPPFGGRERPEVQQNFTIKTSETAYLFLEHFIKYLRAGGQAGIVIKNTFLSNTDNAAVALRKKLLEECNLHTVLDLPSGVFQAGVKTVVLFFKKGEPTRRVWFYQLNPGRTLGKTEPLNEQDLSKFVELQKNKSDSENSWSVKVTDLNDSLDLTPKNPNKIEVIDDRSPQQIAAEIQSLSADCQRISIAPRKENELLQARWEKKKIEDVCEIRSGRNQKTVENPDGPYPIYGSGGIMGHADDYICEAGTTIIGRKGSINNPIYVDTRFWNVDTAFGFSPNETILPKFLYYFCRGFNFQEMNKGTTIPSLVKTDLLQIPISVPPLSEQQRIVDLLDREFEKINTLRENAKKILSSCDDLQQALLRDALSGEL